MSKLRGARATAIAAEREQTRKVANQWHGKGGRMELIRKTALGLLAVALLGCETSRSGARVLPTAPQKDEAAPQAATSAIWAAQVVDTIGPGAVYGLFVPYNWDESGRRLMVYVHPYDDLDAPIALPAFAGLRDSVGKKGFAVAVSSFSENGYVIRDGEQRTHQLRGLFASRFGEPARTYIYGKSMGGLIGLMLAEKYPEQYSGLFAECGNVRGAVNSWRYYFDVRRLFDYFYPESLGGGLPGNALGVPADWQLTPADTHRIDLAMIADMTGALAIRQIDQTPIQPLSASNAEVRQAILDLLIFHSFGVNDLMERAHGRPPVSSSTFTSSTLDPALLESINEKTLHFEAAPDAQNFLANAYEPTGDVRIPVMTFMNPQDPLLPSVLNDLVYQSRVDAAGRSDMFVRNYSVTRYGHCLAKLPERLNAFLNFVRWAESKTATAP
jgi:pimeloyl-ACP methyl ester carboxylesterase